MGGEQHKVDGGGAEGDQGEGDAGGDGARQELHIYHWQAGLPSALPLFQTQLRLWFPQQER